MFARAARLLVAINALALHASGADTVEEFASPFADAKPPPGPPPPGFFTAAFPSGGAAKKIWGIEPPGVTNAPVYIFVGGGGAAGAPYTSNTSLEFLPVKAAAAKGFVAALLEPIGSLLDCGSLDQNARDMFMNAAIIPDDSSAIAAVCSRPAANCTRGVVVHGFSMGNVSFKWESWARLDGPASRFDSPTAGGLQTPLASKHNPLVTATVAWSAGNVVPGWNSTCSIHVPPAQRSCKTSDVGGTEIECLKDYALTQHLPREKRRVVIGQNDSYYGGWDMAHRYVWPMYSAAEQCKEGSGFDCPYQIECFNADGAHGAGYAIPNIKHDLLAYMVNASTKGPNTVNWGLDATLDWLLMAGVKP